MVKQFPISNFRLGKRDPFSADIYKNCGKKKNQSIFFHQPLEMNFRFSYSIFG